MAGSLLVASPRLVDPNFVRTVVALLNHDENGAMGLVVNRPTDMPVADHLPEWEDSLVSPPVVFYGGPVEQAVAIGLRRSYDAGRAPRPFRAWEWSISLRRRRMSAKAESGCSPVIRDGGPASWKTR